MRKHRIQIPVIGGVGVVVDTTAPTITSADPSGGYAEMVPVSGTLTANEAVTWSKSGADAARVTLNPATGVWSLETTDFETKTSYAWTFTATDPSLNATNQNVAITITDVDEIPAAFAFTDVTGATVSTQYTSNTITVSGLASGVSVPVAVSGGTYSKNGGAFTSSAGTATNGDTFAVRQTSSASNSTGTNVVLTIGGVSDTYTVTTAATSTFAASFGALTPAGSGGYPVAGTAISSGDTSGHWQIVSGFLCPSTAGDTADLNLGPYSLVLNNGDTINVTIASATRHVRTATEFTTAMSAAGASETVKLRATAISGTIALSTLTKTSVTVAQETGGSLTGLTTISAVTGVTFSGVKWAYDSTTFYIKPHGIVTVSSSSNVTFSNCEVDGTSALGIDYRYEAIRTSGSTTVIDGCNLHHCRTGVIGSTPHGTVTVTNNTIHHFYEDGYSVDDHDGTITDNEFYASEGRSGRRWNGTVTGTINPGEILTLGSGTSKKIIQVATVAEDNIFGGSGTPVTTTYVDGFYNNYSKPVAGETFTSGSGATILISSEGTTFDGRHGDAMQPINNNATDARNLTIARNLIRREAPYNFDALGEPNIQGIFIENAKGEPGSSNTTYDWGAVVIEANILAGGQANQIWLDGSPDATVINNTVIQTEANAGRSKITLSNCTATCYGNLADNGSGGVILDGGGNTLTLTDFDGDNNGGVVMTSATQSGFFSGLFSYPQALSQFIPTALSAADTNKAGALLTDGSWRPTDLPASGGGAGPSVVEAAAVTGSSSSSTTASIATFTPGAGTNRRIVVAVQWHGSGGSAVSCSVVGGTAVAMTQLAIKGSAATLTGSNEGIALFALAEASWPTGSSFAINATVTHTGTPSAIGMEAVTVKDAPNAANGTVSAGNTAINGTTSLLSASITPASASNLVLGFYGVSFSSSTITWSAGLTRRGSTFQYPASPARTAVTGTATQGASAFTCTSDASTGRGMMILTAFAP